ncbi:procollagen C-endopeptidase enhancer, putative, partial [Ixodes scapularis]
EFNDFELEKDNKCISDYVSVYEGNDTSAPLLGTYCGNTAPLPILSSSNQIYMVFKSDSDVQGKGFSATYTEVYKDLVARRGSEQRICSHAKYGNQLYENNIDHGWVIRAPAGHVRLRFSAFDVEKVLSLCLADYVRVFDGNDESAPLLKNVCGDQLPGEIISSSDSLLLRFHTDHTVRKAGF